MALLKFNDDSLLISLDLGLYATYCAVFQKSKKLFLEFLTFTKKTISNLKEALVSHFKDLGLVFSEVLKFIKELCKSSFSKVQLGFSLLFHFFRFQAIVALNSIEVTQKDLDLSIKTARTVPLPDGYAYLENN